MTNFIFLIFFSLSFLVHANSDSPFKNLSAGLNQELYIPQKFDFSVGLGNGWSTSSYILVDGFIAYRVFSCANHCFAYVEGAEKILAQRGQTNYISLAGMRFQKYFDGSSWGPFIRFFGGVNHYLFSGNMQDFGVGGLGIGTIYALHPYFDLRMGWDQGFGPTSWSMVSVGAVLKLRNF